MKIVKINSEFIKLDQALKLGELVQSGGHAKIVIQDGLIKVNGTVENQRGKKIKVGDIIEFEKNKIVIK
ncbi:MAG: RNA-binding S4 domain-containing protein [Alkaliphilus sp.]|nr:RNA-binding S4 domain-containing protein [Alkaliphilus sp.]